MKTYLWIALAALCLALGGCAGTDTDTGNDPASHPSDQPPGETHDGLGIMQGGPGFKKTF